ncbi:tRNA (guanosine(46)-N7)-methyltransferase TrmB [Candidatus Sumerlaeota bacterium]|nr:tRNA (guanosine(46)-N7)-methyltransferase TrmB [Candidatus Sumerlaeota bacterium]
MTLETTSNDLLTRLRPAERFFERDELPKPLDWEAEFGARAPVEVEIGCGNGRFLRRAAEDRPDTLFLGIERALKYARLANERMIKYGIGNVRIVRADAARFLADRVPESSVDALHVYFTDPWPKKRHVKRRLFQTPFLDTVHRILRPGAPVWIKVDLFWYFEEILGRFERSPHFRVTANSVESDPTRDVYETTGFEQKALRMKGIVFALRAENLA